MLKILKAIMVDNVCSFCLSSPRSGTSSNASTPSAKKMEEKPTTPISKSVTPTSGGSGSSVAGSSALKPLVKTPTLGKFFFRLQLVPIPNGS